MGVIKGVSFVLACFVLMLIMFGAYASAEKDREESLKFRVLSENQNRHVASSEINARKGINVTIESTGNESRVKARLSNGRFADIKYMPESASAVALERMNAQCGDRNCSVELKEVGRGNESRIAYEVRAEKKTRLFWMFNKKMDLRAEVDAESGEVISVRKPWWAFLARGD